MSIEPKHFIEALKRIDANTPVESFIQGLYAQLPKCIQRAIGTLQCVQLEDDYRVLRTRLMADLGFDLHQHIRAQIEKILTRPR